MPFVAKLEQTPQTYAHAVATIAASKNAKEAAILANVSARTVRRFVAKHSEEIHNAREALRAEALDILSVPNEEGESRFGRMVSSLVDTATTVGERCQPQAARVVGELVGLIGDRGPVVDNSRTTVNVRVDQGLIALDGTMSAAELRAKLLS
jgi:hypothetical protein